MAHPGQMRIIILPVHVSAHTHDQQSHLLIPIQQAAVGAVTESVRTHRAGIHRAHSIFEDLVAFFQTALTGAEHALILSGESIPDPVLQKGTGAHNNGRLAEVFQHGEKLFLDGRHELPVQQTLPEFRRNTKIVLRFDHFGSQIPGVVLYRVGIEHVRADVVGIVGFNAFYIELRIRIPDDVACQQHADGLAPDASRSDLPALDLHQVPHGEVLPAELQPGRLRTQQTAHDVIFQCDTLRVRRLRMIDTYRVEHAVPTVPAFSGLGKDIKNGIRLAAGGDRFALRAMNTEREVHVLAVASLGFHRMNVHAAVHRPDVYEDIRSVADPRNGFIDVPLILQRNITECTAGSNKLTGQAEEVTDHQI